MFSFVRLSAPRFAIIWKEPRPYGVRKSKATRAASMAAKLAKRREIRAAERKQGILLDGVTHFRFALKQNYGIGWSRSLQVLQHLEMHQYSPPRVDPTPHFKQRVLEIVKLVKNNTIVEPTLLTTTMS